MKKLHKILAVVLLIILISALTSFLGAGTIVFAADSFETSDVMTDLNNSTVNGVDFDATDYPVDVNGTIQVIDFVEYAFAEKPAERSYYSLFVYVYNPALTNIVAGSGQNKIEMASAYDNAGNPTNYEKYNIQLCSSSADGLFYKYKIIDHIAADNSTFATRANVDARRYDIAGIEILTRYDRNATDYTVGKTFTFSGFSKGLAADAAADANLTCTTGNQIETLELTLNHTYYRTGVSSLGAAHYNQVNTVYFSVPDDVLNDYDRIESITAEWWEYKTAVAAVTSNRDVYQQLLMNSGYKLNNNPDTTNNYYDRDIPYSLLFNRSILPGGSTAFDWAYNLNPWYGNATTATADDYSYIIPYVFYAEAVGTDTLLDLFYKAPAGDIDSTVVEDYIYNYSNNLNNGYIDCNGRQIAADLFESYIDAARAADGINVGYNKVTTRFDDTFDLNSYDTTHAWLSKLFDFGIRGLITNTNEGYTDVLPIELLTVEKLAGTAAEVSKRLLINEDDVTDIKAFQTAEAAEGRTTVLFRFATTDYTSMAVVRQVGTGYNVDTFENDTYVASQTVFLDFDVLYMDFCRAGTTYTMPVVASPIDIINDIESPAIGVEIPDWIFKLILSISIILIVVLTVLMFGIGIRLIQNVENTPLRISLAVISFVVAVIVSCAMIICLDALIISAVSKSDFQTAIKYIWGYLTR